MDPIHQFEITNIFTFGQIGGLEIAFTNSALFMLIALAVIALLMLGATASRALVPGRMQSVAEMSYEFVANTLRSTAGTEGMKFFPLVFSLFMFILTVNLIGLIPYTFTVTSHIIVTVSLALLVFFTVLIYGFWKNGLHFFKLFVPSGIPIYILPLVTSSSRCCRSCRGRSRTACGCSPTCWPATSRSRCSAASSPCSARSACSAGSARCCRSR